MKHSLEKIKIPLCRCRDNGQSYIRTVVAKIKKPVKRFIVFLLFVVLLITAANHSISLASKGLVYDEIETIPENKVGLILGTSKYLSDGTVNYYFKNRIDAALALYKAGKIQYIVVSGDNGRKTYNEPWQMKNDLIAGGVPPERIFPDYAGFRTLDSVIRMNEIFGQSRFTVISQKFHNERAVFLAKRNGMNVCAYNAEDVGKYLGFKTKLREKFARVKVFTDIIIHKQPKFLGDKIEIK